MKIATLLCFMSFALLTSDVSAYEQTDPLQKKPGQISPTAEGEETITSVLTEFSDAVTEAHMVFEKPEGYEPVAVVESEHFSYQYAIRSASGCVEIRYSVIPIINQAQQYIESMADENCHMIDPNSEQLLMACLFSLVMNLNGGDPNIPIEQFDPDAVQNEFNADWGASAPFTPRPDFAEFQMGCIVMIHRNNLAQAFVVALFNDLQEQQTQQEWLSAFLALRFADPVSSNQ